MKDTIQKKKVSFKSYVNDLFLNEKLKSFISDDSFIDKNPSGYLFYPEIFFPAFSENGDSFSQDLDKLNIAGYLYYRSILEMDSTIDSVELPTGKQPEKHILPILCSVCQEESIKLLTSIFQLNPVFWERWNNRRSEFMAAIIMDKKNPQNISLNEFEVLADYKSAFGKVAIDCVYTITGSTKLETYQNVLESHKFFSVGFQLLDDIMDFKKDIINPQVNFAYISLKNYFNENGIDYSQYDSITLNKYLYIHGIAEKLLILSIDYFNRALKIVADYKLVLWEYYINQSILKANSMLVLLKTYDKVIDSKIKLSNNLLQINNLTNAIDLAKEFLKTNQNKDGFWEDFINNAGISNVWATGYILSNVSDLHTGFDKDCINRACSFLINNKQGQIWGYNTKWIEDIDSSTLVMLALKLNGYDISKELDYWLTLQNENGGFSTYASRNQLAKSLNYEFENFDGWTDTHKCVSAMAYFFLCKTDLAKDHREKLKKYLLQSQNLNGLLESYWWTSPLYSSSYFLQSNVFEKNWHEENHLSITLSSLVNLQDKDGSFMDNFSERNHLYTALALSALCSSLVAFNSFRQEADNAARWLIQNQYTDGSFASAYSLQIPKPEVIDTESIKNWSKSNQFTTNVLAEDFRRIFTTSAALKALDTYYKLVTNG